MSVKGGLCGAESRWHAEEHALIFMEFEELDKEDISMKLPAVLGAGGVGTGSGGS